MLLSFRGGLGVSWMHLDAMANSGNTEAETARALLVQEALLLRHGGVVLTLDLWSRLSPLDRAALAQVGLGEGR